MTAAALMVAGFPVEPGRCPHCGHSKPTWTPGRILEALREDAAARGRTPFQYEWRAATIGTPAAETVREMFGSWASALALAGLEPAIRSNSVRHWTRDEVIAAIFDWRYRHGGLPRAHDWAHQTAETPSWQQVRRLFGSWNAAIAAAGYEPRRSSREGYSTAAKEAQ